MQRVIGIGGIFFKAKDPETLGAWYKKHLGLDVQEWGGASFTEGGHEQLTPKRQAYIVWSPFETNTEYFAPSTKEFMINYRVHNLEEVLAALRNEGVQVDDKTDESEFGKFGWVVDPEGNKLELWEPPEAKS
ncbi:MAG TPA: VOC family protein [Chthoniobacterales bacterium]|nr:VOC family protein [Chthoniobacterales bacterium]